MEMSKEKIEVKKNRRKTINIATWNVRGTNEDGALNNLVKEMKKYRIEILTVQETKRTANDVTEVDNYVFFNSGGENRYLGTGFLISERIRPTVIKFEAVSERLCFLRLKAKHRKLSLINVHAPTEEKSEEEKEEFYELLENIYQRLPESDMKIILGDMNAKVGTEEYYKPAIGRYSKHTESNENGRKLISFALEKEMRIISTDFQRKEIYKGTWRSPDGQTINQIDHVLIPRRYAKYATNVVSCRGADANTDHFLVRICLDEEANTNKKKPKRRTKKKNILDLQNEEKRLNYSSALNLKAEELSKKNNIEEKWTGIQEIILKTAAKVLTEKPINIKKKWFTKECIEEINARNVARQKMIKSNSEDNKLKYQEQRRKAKDTCRKAKRTYLDKEMKDLETKYINREIKNFYQEVKKSRGEYRHRTIYIKDKEGNLLGNNDNILQRWKEHFDETLNQGVQLHITNDTTQQQNLTVGRQGELDDNEVTTPTLEELTIKIKSLKNNKCPGENELASELIKYGGETIQKQIYELVTDIWSKEKMPKSWTTAIIKPLFKKGDKTDCNNYRAIALLDTTYKILASLIKDKLTGYAEKIIGDYQCGFRCNRSVTDQIFTLKQVQSNCYEYKQTIYALFVDFKQAYDSINRERLYEIMKKLGVPTKLVRLVKMTLEGSTNKVSYNGETSDAFIVRQGLRQGDPLSTVLFNVALEKIIRDSGINRCGTLFTKSHQCLAYADDVTLLARTKAELKMLVKNMEAAAKEIGLCINSQKSKYMEMGGFENRGRPQQNENLKVSLTQESELVFEKVSSVTFLGVLITDNGDNSKEISARIAKGDKCVGSLKEVLKSKEVSRSAKARIYKTVVRPTVMYGSETWTYNKADQMRIEVWERRVLRKIYGGIKVGDTWERRSNKDLMEVFGETGITNQIKAGRIRWLGHMERLTQERATKKVLRGSSEGTRKQGRPRRKWLEAVREDLVKLDIRNWREVATDRKSWRKVVEAAMGLNGL